MAVGSSISGETLATNNPDYNDNQLSTYQALYDGGERFRKLIDAFLPKRPIEAAPKAASGVDGEALYSLRKESASYNNRAGGLVDFFIAKVYSGEPFFEVPEDAPDDTKEYWSNLSKDADGAGNSIGAIARKRLLDSMLHLRSYFYVFQDDGSQPYISGLSPLQVNDWQLKENGTIDWLRVMSKDFTRNGFDPVNGTDVFWTYYTEDSQDIFKYHVESTDSKQIKVELDGLNDSLVPLYSTKPISAGMPVFNVHSWHSHWIMDRIHESVISLFRREASIDWYLDSGAYQLLVLKLENAKQNKLRAIPASTMAAIAMGTSENIQFVSPDMNVGNLLFKDIERLKNTLLDSVHSMAKDAASIPQAGRMSGETVKNMMDPLNVVLRSFQMPINDAMNQVIEYIKKIRKEENIDIKFVAEAPARVEESEIKEVLENGSPKEESGGSESGDRIESEARDADEGE